MAKPTVKDQIENLKKATASFLHSFGLEAGTLDYITEKYLEERNKAVRLVNHPSEICEAKIHRKN